MTDSTALSQVEHEIRCADAGYARAIGMMKRNEESGRVENNPYMNPLLRRWLGPLAEAIEAELTSTGKPGRRGAHVVLLRPLDSLSVAFLGIRELLRCTVGGGEHRVRAVARIIGKMLYEELVLSTFEHINPELFWKVSRDLNQRRSKNIQHRYHTLRHAANGAAIELPVWSIEDREQVGMCVVELLRVIGMVEVTLEKDVRWGTHKSSYSVFLSDDVAKLVATTREAVGMALPCHQPCIERPKDWVAINDGGFHTTRLRRTLPCCVNLYRANRDAYKAVSEADLSQVMRSINHLQGVQWQVNPDLYEALQVIGKRMNLDEIVAQEFEDRPPPPDWLTREMTKDHMTAEQLAQFIEWKHSMRGWYERRKMNGVKWGRMVTAMTMGTRFGPERHYRPFHFVYQADFRGRLYAMTNGITPQGSDLQKALLRFYEGKPLRTPHAQMWFKVGGTSKFGFDKASFADRVRWVDTRHHQIVDCAKNPTNGGLWLEADKPLQFLAWCMEYARWQEEGDRFLSHLPIGFDGSCNGLQHFSAMLRDSVGGKAVNLLDAETPNDIYGQVATVCQARLLDLKTDQLPERDSKFRDVWLAHGINRTLVKRSVMTLPYGSTRYSCAEFIVDDYLRKGLVPDLGQLEHRDAANFLSHHVWGSIGEVVVAARQGMDWLQRCSGSILTEPGTMVSWTTPTGFKVVQVYNEVETTQVRSMLLGGSVKIKIGSEGDKVDPRRHKNGIAPNFVHSMDAAHLVLTTNACAEAGIASLAMIHDDYGTHAADAQRLYELIRKTFVEMYETNDPLGDFAAGYPGLPDLPLTGGLDVRKVLDSRFFFA